MTTTGVTDVRDRQFEPTLLPGGRRRRAVLALLPIVLVAVLSACLPGTGSGSGSPNVFGAVPGPFGLTVRVVSATDDPAALRLNTSLDVRREGSISLRMAMFGPDGRLYVVDALPAEILAFELVRSPFGASFRLAATYSYPGLINPTVIEFSPEGDLWVVDALTFDGARPQTNRLYRFADPSGVRGSPVLQLEAQLTLTSSAGAGFKHTEISALLFDRAGRLWYTDFNDSSIGRIDAPGNLSGTSNTVTPDHLFTMSDRRAQGPTSLTFDPQGRLYLGYRGHGVVLRYDDPDGIASGTTGAEPSAIISIDPPILDTSLVGFDHTGALLIVSDGGIYQTHGELLRVERPWEGSGELNLSAVSRFQFPFFLGVSGGAFKLHLSAVQPGD